MEESDLNFVRSFRPRFSNTISEANDHFLPCHSGFPDHSGAIAIEKK